MSVGASVAWKTDAFVVVCEGADVRGQSEAKVLAEKKLMHYCHAEPKSGQRFLSSDLGFSSY